MRVLCLLLFAYTAAADPCRYDEAGELTTLMSSPAFRSFAERAQGGSFTEGMRVIAWDHVYDRATAYTWRNGSLSVSSAEIRAGEPVVVFVTRSNPFLFRAAATPITRSDSDDVELLKKYAALAGAAIRGSSKSRGPADQLENDLAELEAVASDISRMYAAALEYAQLVELRDSFVATLPDGKDLASAAQRLSSAASRVRRHAAAEANESLKRVSGAMKTAAWLHSFGEVVAAYKDAPCQGIDAPVLVHAGRFVAETGTKLSGGFKLVATVDDEVIHSGRPAPFERKVTVSASSRWGLGAGLAYTPEFEENEVALFANFHPDRWRFKGVSAGWQLGFGTSTDQPAIYIGPSLDLGPMLRVGGGYAINRHTGGFYLSLSLSLDGIPLFN